MASAFSEAILPMARTSIVDIFEWNVSNWMGGTPFKILTIYIEAGHFRFALPKVDQASNPWQKMRQCGKRFRILN
jgi:hypothetical protein